MRGQGGPKGLMREAWSRPGIVRVLGSDLEIKMQDKPFKKDVPRRLSSGKMRAGVLDSMSRLAEARLFTIPPT